MHPLRLQLVARLPCVTSIFVFVFGCDSPVGVTPNQRGGAVLPMASLCTRAASTMVKYTELGRISIATEHRGTASCTTA